MHSQGGAAFAVACARHAVTVLGLHLAACMHVAYVLLAHRNSSQCRSRAIQTLLFPGPHYDVAAAVPQVAWASGAAHLPPHWRRCIMVSKCTRDPPENDRPKSQQDESVLQRTSGDNLLSLCCTGNACRDSPDGGPLQCGSQGRRASLAALVAAAAAAALPSGRAQAEAPVLEQAREAEQQADVDLTITDRVYLDIGAPPLGPAASCHLTDHAWRLHVAAQSPPPFSGPSLIHPAGCNDACEGRQEEYVAPMSLIASKCCLENGQAVQRVVIAGEFPYNASVHAAAARRLSAIAGVSHRTAFVRSGRQSAAQLNSIYIVAGVNSPTMPCADVITSMQRPIASASTQGFVRRCSTAPGRWATVRLSARTLRRWAALL